MATLAELDLVGSIFKIDPGLDPAVQPERLIYASPRLVHWIDQTLHQLVSDLGVESSPLEQVGILFEEFCSGEELAVGPRFHVMRPAVASVWELKTPDIRIFGWFALRDHFVACAADTADRCKRHDLYSGYRTETINFRNQLDLNEPKFVAGDAPHAVVSNYHYP